MQRAHINMLENAFVSDDLQPLTLDESENVGGGFPLVVIAIAVACAVLLAHD